MFLELVILFIEFLAHVDCTFNRQLVVFLVSVVATTFFRRRIKNLGNLISLLLELRFVEFLLHSYLVIEFFDCSCRLFKLWFGGHKKWFSLCGVGLFYFTLDMLIKLQILVTSLKNIKLFLKSFYFVCGTLRDQLELSFVHLHFLPQINQQVSLLLQFLGIINILKLFLCRFKILFKLKVFVLEVFIFFVKTKELRLFFLQVSQHHFTFLKHFGGHVFSSTLGSKIWLSTILE